MMFCAVMDNKMSRWPMPGTSRVLAVKSPSVNLSFGQRHHGWVQTLMDWSRAPIKLWKSSAQHRKHCPSMVASQDCFWVTSIVSGIRTISSSWVKHAKTGTFCRFNYSFIGAKKICDLVVWSPSEAHVIEVPYDAEYINSVIPKLESIYFMQLLPAIVDSRSTY